PVDDPQVPTTGRRLAYARHLTSGQHPLVPRVLVNRVWLLHFGRGIVGTPADFGMLGERPSHPELLDWLAAEFLRGGWSLKRLHRVILTSSAYRQSSRRAPAHEAVDPDNRLMGRMPVRRLEAEAIRDAILTASGRLTPKMFGPPVPVAPDESGQVIVGRDNRDSAGRPVGQRASLGAEEFRRSLYVQVRRSLPLGVLETFDAPPMAPNCRPRTASTVAPQALRMMNNEFVVAQAEAFARRVAAEASPSGDVAAQARLAWRIALAAAPDDAQVAAAAAFVTRQREDLAAAGDKDAGGHAPARFRPARLSSHAFLHA